jgi:hypothetical protein
MDTGNITRTLLEGALNAIGFFIGSAIVGLLISGFLILAHHLTAIVTLTLSGVLLWTGFRGRRFVRTRIERIETEEDAQATSKPQK